jgi:hypothetical protein
MRSPLRKRLLTPSCNVGHQIGIGFVRQIIPAACKSHRIAVGGRFDLKPKSMKQVIQFGQPLGWNVLQFFHNRIYELR